MATAAEPWTTKALLEWTIGFFRRKGLDSPRLAAEMLLSHVLGTTRLKLYMEPGRPASEIERGAFRELVQRAAQHEPVDYLVGQAPFFSMSIEVNRSVLIPRPSSETLVEHILQHVRQVPGFQNPTIAEIGVGSGAIAVALAKHWPTVHITATDTSDVALEQARHNAEKHQVSDRITFLQGDLYEPLGRKRFGFIVANLPYISDDEWAQVPSNVKDYEPTKALRGGVDGLKYLRPLIEHARPHLTDPGQLVLEIAASQKKTVKQLAEHAEGLSNAHVLADHEALPRVLVADAAS